MTEKMDTEFMTDYAGRSAKVCYIQRPPVHKGKTAYPEPQYTQGINEEVHGHGMGHIFLLGKSRFDHGETALHEHDEKSCQQGPDNIDGDLVMATRIPNRGNRSCKPADAFVRTCHRAVFRL